MLALHFQSLKKKQAGLKLFCLELSVGKVSQERKTPVSRPTGGQGQHDSPPTPLGTSQAPPHRCLLIDRFMLRFSFFSPLS